MAKFTNTTHKVTVDSLVDGFKEKIKNPYNMHIDKKPTLTTYYNQNTKKSTLDEGFKTEYSALGKNSPLKFNKVNNFFIYGLERITTELENGEWGLESSSIEGDAIVLPNTIVPIPNDYFTINHCDKKLLFKVINSTVNTIESGANFYKIEYKLDQFTDEEIEKQVEDKFEMVVNNVGTQFNTIIRSEDYDFIDKVESVLDRLKTYYCNLFYKDRVQTFILNYDSKHFYDPYLIEFLKKHNLINNNGDYLYIAHQTYIPATFSLDYDKTMFRMVEKGVINKNKPRTKSQADIIDEYLSILCTRAESYYKINYIGKHANPNNFIIENFNHDLLDRIYENKLFKEDNYLNIIIKYFNNVEIKPEDIYAIEDIDFEHDIVLFYNIPVIIYILEHKVKSILKNR